MRPTLHRCLLIVAALAVSATASAQRGALTVQRNLDHLVDRSAVILRGQIQSAHVEKHPELKSINTVVVTLRVLDSLKGDAGKTFTFRQYVWDFRDSADMAGYRKGQEFLLLMIAPSRYGLSSPAGLEQGRFRIRRDPAGRATAVNAHGNARLLDGIAEQLAKEGKSVSPSLARTVAGHQKGPIDLEELTSLIHALSSEQN
jgi:hypothetical protein